MDIHKNIISLFVVMSILMLTACAGKPQHRAVLPEEIASQRGYEIVKPVKKLSNFSIDSWSYISPKALKIRAGVKDEYLIVLMHACYGLRSVDVIASTSTVESLTTFDAILVNSDVSGKESCPITGIYKIIKNNSDK